MRSTAGRTAILCRRAELSGINRDQDERDMRTLASRLGYRVLGSIVEIDPDIEGPLTTVLLALARTEATAAIVPDLEHVDGIDAAIRLRAQLITVAGERVLAKKETAQSTPAAS